VAQDLPNEKLSMSIFGDTGQQRTESRLYHDVPTSGEGSESTNYDTTFYGYDDSGRPTRTVPLTETLTTLHSLSSP
jgi:hypothetical protein